MKVHAGWLAAAIVAGMVVAPAAAIATTQLVKISGPSGSVAQVDPANRLQVAESSPSAYHESGYKEVDQTIGCQTLVHVPSTRAFMVTQVSIEAKGPSFDVDHGLAFASQPDCLGAFVLIHIPTEVGTQILTLDPPLPIPAGGVVDALAFGGGTHTEVNVRGYFVPKSAVS